MYKKLFFYFLTPNNVAKQMKNKKKPFCESAQRTKSYVTDEQKGFAAVIRCLATLFEFECAGVKLIIPTPLRYQLLVIAALDNLAVFENANHIGIADGGQAVSDDKDGATLHKFVHTLLDEFFGAGVDGTGRFVEDEDGRICDSGARDCEKLTLTLREVFAVAG